MASVCRLNRRYVRQCSIIGVAVAVVMICVLLFHVHPALYGGASDNEGLFSPPPPLNWQKGLQRSSGSTEYQTDPGVVRVSTGRGESPTATAVQLDTLSPTMRDSDTSSSLRRTTHDTEVIGGVEEKGGNTESAVNNLPSHTTAQHNGYTLQQMKAMQTKKKIEGSDKWATILQQDMERCSLALGVSQDTLRKEAAGLEQVSKKASAFLKGIWSVVPKNYSDKFKNPCWYSDIFPGQQNTHVLRSRRQSGTQHEARNVLTSLSTNSINAHSSEQILLCMPHFFLAGFAKCGTTSFYNALKNHPQIVEASTKETQWWTRVSLPSDPHVSQLAYRKLVFDYLLMFKRLARVISSDHDLITLDASASTIADSNFFVNNQEYCTTPALVSKVLPRAKFIILLRNPVNRTYSNYLFACTQKFGRNTEGWPSEVRQSAAERFHEQVIASIRYFNECLGNLTLFECVNLNRFRSKGIKCGEVGFRLTNSLYYSHIAKWIQFFPKEQFLFLKTEDLSSKSPEVMSKVTKFLSLSDVSPEEASLWLSKQGNSQQSIVSQSPVFQMRENTVELLERFFQPYNTMLAELTGDSRFLHWRD